jgi:RND family efflux transporter MFP subunit
VGAKTRWFFPWLVVLLAAGLGLVIGRETVANRSAHPALPAAPQPGTVLPPTVGVVHPKRAAIPVTLQVTANISSLRSAVIYTKTAGYLQTVTVRPGDVIHTGQVLAIVDHAPLEAQVAQAEANLQAATTAAQTARVAINTAQAQEENAVAGWRSAQAQVANAQAGVAKARAALVDALVTQRRTTDLVRQGAEAQQMLDDANAQAQSDQADLNAAVAGVRAVQAQVAQAAAQLAAAREQIAGAASQWQSQLAQIANQQAALQNAELMLAEATILSPLNGVVVSRTLDPGAFVTPDTTTPILTVADLDRTDVSLNVTEVNVSRVRVGASAAITVDAYPGRTFRGRVSRIAGGADPQTRTVEVEIDIPNPAHLLRPGMYATVALSAGEERKGLVLPLAALMTVGDQQSVWIVTHNTAHQRSVTVGEASSGVAEVTGGITAGDQVVVQGADGLRENERVRTMPAGL